MNKNVFRLLVISGLVSVSLLNSCVGKRKQAEPDIASVSIVDLLNAHHVLEDPDVTSVFIAEAQRTVSFRGSGGKSSGKFTRLITVARYCKLFRYERVNPQAPTRQIDLFDGSTVRHVIAANGRLIEEYTRPGDSPSEAVGLEIKTFGLLPILGRLIETKESIYKGITAEGWHKLQVKPSTRIWTVYADSERLIRRLEFQDNAVEYDDYHVIEGVRLPFKQRFFVRNELYYQLSFTRIDLKPAFPQDYFSHEKIRDEILR